MAVASGPSTRLQHSPATAVIMQISDHAWDVSSVEAAVGVLTKPQALHMSAQTCAVTVKGIS